jgi:hypothetical protein
MVEITKAEHAPDHKHAELSYGARDVGSADVIW